MWVMARAWLLASQIRHRDVFCVYVVQRAAMEEGWGAGIAFGDARVRPPWCSMGFNCNFSMAHYKEDQGRSGQEPQQRHLQLAMMQACVFRYSLANTRRGASCQRSCLLSLCRQRYPPG